MGLENYRQSIRDQVARHRPNSTVYHRHYANARINAISQDAGLGRGTESPYLDILNHIGLEYDENAPTGVSDEVMRAIGPDSRIRRLEREWADLQTALAAKYGNASDATGADKKTQEQLRNELKAAKQRHRRKLTELLRKDHFRERNEKELDRQLRGVHGPQQPLQKVIFSLPERRILADILGNLNEDLPEDEIVRRKVDAINAWIDYAWKIEPKELGPSQDRNVVHAPATGATELGEAPQAALHLPVRGRAVAPKPRYARMIQDPVSPSVPMPLATDAFQEPPPPYSAIDKPGIAYTAVLGRSSMSSRPAAQQPTPRRPHECLFCRRRFTRKGKMWDCTQRHLMRRPTEAVPCPDPGCQSRGVVLDNELQFKNHAKVVHNRELRPTICWMTWGAEPLGDACFGGLRQITHCPGISPSQKSPLAARSV